MAETTLPKKYLFDLAFDSEVGKPVAEREKPKPTYTQEQLDAEKQKAYDAGVTAGQNAAAQSQQQAANVLLADIGRTLGKLWDNGAADRKRHAQQMQEIAVAIARKIMPIYVARHGIDEIETIVTKIIADMSREPRLVIRVSEEHFDDIDAKINAIAENQAYAGKIVTLGDAELGPSDCRIEWADGGIERDLKSLWADIDALLPPSTLPLESLAAPASSTATQETTPPSPAPDSSGPASGEQS